MPGFSTFCPATDCACCQHSVPQCPHSSLSNATVLQVMHVCLVVSLSCPTLQPHGLWTARLLCSWNFPGKNTGMGCHFLLQCMKVETEKWKWSCSVVSDSVIPWTVARQAPLFMEFSRQEYWRGLPFPTLGDLSDSGIKPMSPALQADSLSSEPPGKPSSGYA